MLLVTTRRGCWACSPGARFHSTLRMPHSRGAYLSCCCCCQAAATLATLIRFPARPCSRFGCLRAGGKQHVLQRVQLPLYCSGVLSGMRYSAAGGQLCAVLFDTVIGPQGVVFPAPGCERAGRPLSAGCLMCSCVARVEAGRWGIVCCLPGQPHAPLCLQSPAMHRASKSRTVGWGPDSL
jgi:hypothetical protein